MHFAKTIIANCKFFPGFKNPVNFSSFVFVIYSFARKANPFSVRCGNFLHQLIQQKLGFFIHFAPSRIESFSNMTGRILSPPLIRAEASISRRFVAMIWIAILEIADALWASLSPFLSMSNSSNKASHKPADVLVVDFFDFPMINPSKMPRHDATAYTQPMSNWHRRQEAMNNG